MLPLPHEKPTTPTSKLNPKASTNLSRSTNTKSLEASAHLAARQFLSSRLKDPSSLDEVSSYHGQYTRHLQQTEAQLGTMVQSQMDASKRAMDVIDNTKEQMVQLQNEMKEIQVLTAKVREDKDKATSGGNGNGNGNATNLEDMKHIRMLNVANRNIKATLQRIENFSNVPSRVERLQKALLENPASLKTVFLEAQDLEDWRDELIEEVKKFGSSTRDSTRDNAHTNTVHSPEIYNKIIEVLGGHFDVVLQLSQQVRTVVKEHISNCIDLAIDNPALLVRALEVLVLIEETYRLKCNKLSPEQLDNLPFDPRGAFTSDVVSSMKTKFDSRIQKSYASYMFQAADDGKTGMEATLGAATHGIVDMSIINQVVLPCFPPFFKVLSVYRERFESYMAPQVEALWSQNVSAIDIGDLLRLTTWIYQYNTQILLSGKDVAGEPTREFVDAVEMLMDEYLSRMSLLMSEWFMNIEGRKAEILPDAEGHLVTRGPEDMLNIVNMQISVAREQLPNSLSIRAVRCCILELRKSQERTRVRLEETWRTTAIERIICIVNDSFRFQDSIEALIGHLNIDDNDGLVRNSGILKTLNDSLDELMRGYVELAVFATKIAAWSIMEDLRKPVLSLVFLKEWEDGEDLIPVTIKTLTDYFLDLKVWIPDYFYTKLVRECFEVTMKSYVEACFVKRKFFLSSASASQNIFNDWFKLSNYFSIDCLEVLETSGLRGGKVQILKRLHILQNISSILKSDTPRNCESALEGLLLEFGVQGYEVTMYIVNLKNTVHSSGISMATGVEGQAKSGGGESLLKEWKVYVQNLVQSLGDKLEFIQHMYELPQFALPTPSSTHCNPSEIGFEVGFGAKAKKLADNLKMKLGTPVKKKEREKEEQRIKNPFG